MTKTVGVIIGRFQTPYLHPGHLDLINQVASLHGKVLILIGEAQTQSTKRDPMDFETRKKMFLMVKDNVTILPLKDQSSDLVWSENVDKIIQKTYPGCNATLYGGRGCFKPHYHGTYKVVELKPKTKLQISSTQLRKEIGQVGPTSDRSFRDGIIYAAEKQYPRSFPTVDIAITRTDSSDKTLVLLGKKHPKDGLRFIGGFVDPRDSSLEDAARRELAEEAGINLAVEGDLSYVGSFRVDDWRYRDTPDAIVTTLFHGERSWGFAQAGDDMYDVDFYPMNKVTESKIIDTHKPLYQVFKSYMIKKQENIDTSDIPELTEEEFKRARKFNKRRTKNGKQPAATN